MVHKNILFNNINIYNIIIKNKIQLHPTNTPKLQKQPLQISKNNDFTPYLKPGFHKVFTS